MLNETQKALAWFALLGCLAVAIGFELNDAARYQAAHNNYTQPNKKSEYVAASESADDRIARYTLWLAIITGGLVGVSAFQGYFLIRADRTATRTSEATAGLVNTGRAQVRAYVHINSAKIDFITPPFIHPLIGINASNSGQSPALNFIWGATLQYIILPGLIHQGAMPRNWLNQVGINIPAGHPGATGGLLVPQMSFTEIVLDRVPDADQIVVRVKIDYRFSDVFGDVHTEAAYFAGLAQRRGQLPGHWIAEVHPMAPIGDWDDNVENSPQQ
jgi:hypothetical protein